ncbi:MAG: CDP-diacylglycerol--glycerol-3-phosphate 3-phosphatidyltransferase [Candidatus Omnitrophica bacterium]|nr:CDP-diacylglycerol--glycerol-3-phosphate 3-phosphatidyltransferase [Candidatus Omnitrophota bacterium]
MNLPNRLTILRIVLAFVFMFLLFSPGLVGKILALVAFTIACVTDFYDGYVARKYNLITDLGKLLDPIADKVLVLAAFLSFVQMRLIPAWMVVVIILRELIVTGIRIIGLKKGRVLAASMAGKHKTVSQMVSIFFILGVIIINESSSAGFSSWSSDHKIFLQNSVYISMIITIALTLISGMSYFIKNLDIFGALKDD